MLKKLLAFTCLTLSIGANAATIVNVRGTDYSIDTFLGSYNDNIVLIESQVWWEDFELASDFAVAIGDSLGTPNGEDGFLSPSFAYSAVPTVFGGGEWEGRPEGLEVNSWDTSEGWVGTTAPIPYDYEWTYAVATPSAVPIPAAAWLFGSALLGLGAIKRRKA
jgi:hypothetical protein